MTPMNIPPQMQAQLQQAMRSFNPSEVLNQIANNPQVMSIPRVQAVMEMRNSHDSSGLNQMATNIFRENGRDFTEFENSMKQQMNFK